MVRMESQVEWVTREQKANGGTYAIPVCAVQCLCLRCDIGGIGFEPFLRILTGRDRDGLQVGLKRQVAGGGVVVALRHSNQAHTRHQHQQIATKEAKSYTPYQCQYGDDVHEGEDEI